MQIKAIQTFVLLSQQKSMSKCSELLHISQQGLSRQVQAMEQELGTVLFSRTNRGVSLTPEGELILPAFRRAWEAYSSGVAHLQRYLDTHKAVLSIVVCPGIKEALGLDFFMRFEQANPSITLRLDFLSDVECEKRMDECSADAAFLDWPTHPEQYDMYPVVHSALYAVMSRQHRLAGQSRISMTDLAGEHIYIPDESHRMRQKFRDEWPEFYRSVVIDSTHNDYYSFYRELPQRLGGVALTFRFLCADLSSELVAIPIQESSFVDISYCVRTDRTPDCALDAFSDYVYRSITLIE